MFGVELDVSNQAAALYNDVFANDVEQGLDIIEQGKGFSNKNGDQMPSCLLKVCQK